MIAKFLKLLFVLFVLESMLTSCAVSSSHYSHVNPDSSSYFDRNEKSIKSLNNEVFLNFDRRQFNMLFFDLEIANYSSDTLDLNDLELYYLGMNKGEADVPVKYKAKSNKKIRKLLEQKSNAAESKALASSIFGLILLGANITADIADRKNENQEEKVQNRRERWGYYHEHTDNTAEAYYKSEVINEEESYVTDNLFEIKKIAPQTAYKGIIAFDYFDRDNINYIKVNIGFDSDCFEFPMYGN